MIIVRVIHGRAPDWVEVELSQSFRQDYVPDPLMAGMICVTSVPGDRMAIVDFEKTIAVHAHDILGGHRPSKIRMIHVGDHWLPGSPPLFEDGIHVVLN